MGHVYGLNFEDGRVRDLSQLFNAKVQKVVEDTTKKLRIVEHLQELAQVQTLRYFKLSFRLLISRRASIWRSGSIVIVRVRT